MIIVSYFLYINRLGYALRLPRRPPSGGGRRVGRPSRGMQTVKGRAFLVGAFNFYC